MFLFTSTLGFDVKRVQAEKYDLFCCSGRYEHPFLLILTGKKINPNSLDMNSGNMTSFDNQDFQLFRKFIVL